MIDTAEFRRLAHISQLGLVSLVYPAAIHTRFEHSLGVYRWRCCICKQLPYDARFASGRSGREDAELFIVAALLHDVGHWPFCHPIEDMQLPSVPQHELFANSFLLGGRDLPTCCGDDWNIQPREIVALLEKAARRPRAGCWPACSVGPIDIDKMDYLVRDSLHAGVPVWPQLRPAAADRQPLPERGGRRPGDHRKGQDRRRDDGLCPLRHVQRSLLASRSARGHGHAAAGVLPAARRWIWTRCFA